MCNQMPRELFGDVLIRARRLCTQMHKEPDFSSNITVETWYGQLKNLPFIEFEKALLDLVSHGNFPPVTKIIEKTNEIKYGLEGLSAELEFEALWASPHPDHQPKILTEIGHRTINRIGGWSTIGNWRLDQRDWIRKSWVEAYNDIRSKTLRGELDPVTLIGGATNVLQFIESAGRSKPKPKKSISKEYTGRNLMGELRQNKSKNH